MAVVFVAGHYGQEINVTLTTDSTNTLNFAGMTIVPFTYDSTFLDHAGANNDGYSWSVTVDDFPGAHFDTYHVKLNYTYPSIPLLGTTIGAIVVIAEAAVTAAIAAGIGGIGGGVSTGYVAPTNVDAVSGKI
jgi:hypothetical protein